jgi:hypothetical protein
MGSDQAQCSTMAVEWGEEAGGIGMMLGRVRITKTRVLVTLFLAGFIGIIAATYITYYAPPSLDQERALIRSELPARASLTQTRAFLLRNHLTDQSYYPDERALRVWTPWHVGGFLQATVCVDALTFTYDPYLLISYSVQN